MQKISDGEITDFEGEKMNVDKFKLFLVGSGAVLLEPTNPYEVIRFRTKNGVSVVYKGKRGYSFTGEAREAFDVMGKKNAWTIIPNGMKLKKRTLKSLIERDGVECFFCPKETTDDNRTIEHLLSVSNGGNTNLANLVIACKDCNVAVGEMPIIEKIRYRDATKGGQ